jgi:hypothetical protein
VLAAHPGYSDTELQRHSGIANFMNTFFAQKAKVGALGGLRAATDPNAKSGDYYGSPSFGETRGHPIKLKSNKLSYNKDNAKKLWKLSEELTGVNYAID